MTSPQPPQNIASNPYDAEFEDYQATRSQFWDQINDKRSLSLGGYYQKRLAHIYQNIVPADSQVLELGCKDGKLLHALKPSIGVGVDFSKEAISHAKKRYPTLEFVQIDAHQLQLGALGGRQFDYIIVSDLVNDLWDVQTVLDSVRPFCHPQTRLVFNFFSHVWNLPLRAARALGLATPNLPQNWLTKHDMNNLLEIAQYETLRQWREIIAPLNIPLVSNFCNRYLAKIWPFELLAITNFIVARPVGMQLIKKPTVSVVIAARNESGHIAELIARVPEMGGGTQIVFVEGNSTDDTYDVIASEIAKHPERNCMLLKQTGKGKGNAVRNGFDAATGDILMILDADITVPPEDLERCYLIMASGLGEFVNGVRLVYPMQDEAMRFLNLLGNKFFSWAFSWLIGQPIRDTLCGTKVLWKTDYQRIADNRKYFGDFDPFGDFDLLFGAARLNLKIVEVPIRYRARRYGETNISRWSHGWLLLKMVAFAARRIKFI
ncbi:glycosyltransferase [Polynucleobacter sp. MWH-P3-07-1]|uniref:glycosyltransferase n=1 Tax=Polynucleobacter sp. MWH-P3-07-1 TaxID=1743173 RepID=UPI001BFD396F|nr:glycosyltransferase [Polynucleobacter sp. MWH-P3-07-1]QWD83828.1 glycosyltransferase [Polynucleobacter sp. MWH-P3-07-1]